MKEFQDILFFQDSVQHHLSNSKEYEVTAIWARKLILSYYFAKWALLWNIKLHHECFYSVNLIKDFQMDKNLLQPLIKTHSGVFDLCLHPRGSKKIFSHTWEGAFGGGAAVWLTLRENRGNWPWDVFKGEVYSTLVSFKPPLFSPVNLSHMSASSVLSLQMFHLRTSKAALVSLKLGESLAHREKEEKGQRASSCSGLLSR